MNVFLQTNFENADGFGHGTVDANGVLRIFCAYPHMDTRNACLQILRSTILTGEGIRRFSYGSHGGTYELFEFAISGLRDSTLAIGGLGARSRYHQSIWYEDARKVLMEAYLGLATNDCTNSFGRRRPLTFLLKLFKDGTSPFNPSKTLKHVIYHTGQLFFSFRDMKRELEGLEEFFHGYLHRQVEDLCGEKILTEENWELVRKIIEFIVGHKYYRTSLHSELTSMEKLLCELRRKQGKMWDMGFDQATRSCLYEQAITLLGYVVHLHLSNIKT